MQTHLSNSSNRSGFLRNPGGSTAVEFAIGGSVLILAMVGIIEIALVMFASVLVEGGLREAARFGITGQDPNGISREQRIVDIVSNNTQGLIEISVNNMTSKAYGSFDYIGKEEPYDDANGNGQFDPGETYTDWNGNAQWDNDPGLPGAGNAGDIVLYEINYDWEFLTPLFAVFAGEDGSIQMTTSVAVQNEPFDLAGGG